MFQAGVNVNYANIIHKTLCMIQRCNLNTDAFGWQDLRTLELQ
jgi:hypothetical protein